MSCYIARVQLLLCCSACHFVILVSLKLTSCICIFVLVSLFKQKRYVSVKSYVSILKMKREFLNTSPPLVLPHIHRLNIWINNLFLSSYKPKLYSIINELSDLVKLLSLDQKIVLVLHFISLQVTICIYTTFSRHCLISLCLGSLYCHSAPM